MYYRKTLICITLYKIVEIFKACHLLTTTIAETLEKAGANLRVVLKCAKLHIFRLRKNAVILLYLLIVYETSI